MKQVVSDKMTMHIQAWSSIALSAVLVWTVYQYPIAPNWGGLVGYLEAGGWMLLASFVAASIVGAVMWVLNLLFFYVQMYRHGSPAAQIEE